MNLTDSAKRSIRELGLTAPEALAVVRRLSAADFDKTMRSDKVPDVFQDAYKVSRAGHKLYVKFSWWEQFSCYRVVSFHEAN